MTNINIIPGYTEQNKKKNKESKNNNVKQIVVI